MSRKTILEIKFSVFNGSDCINESISGCFNTKDPLQSIYLHAGLMLFLLNE